MNILFVCENYIPHYGGAEVVFKNMAELMAKRGHNVTLVTHQLPKTPRFEIMNGVKVHRVPCFDSRYLFSFFSIPTVWRLAKNADVIQTTTFNGAFPAWVAAKTRKKPIVLTVHEIWVNRWRELTAKGPISAWIHNLLEKCIYVLTYDRYACVSNATRTALVKAIGKEDKTLTIHNGFNYEEWEKKYDGKSIRKKVGVDKNFVIFSWGRPGPAKGHEYIIKALPKIKKKIPNVKLILMFSNRKNYKRRQKMFDKIIKANNLQNDILIVDSVPYTELGNYIKAANCVALPSLSEGFGYCVLEACEVGAPVIGTNNASIPEVIWGKYLLIPPKDPDAIAEAAIQISKKEWTTSKKKIFDWNKNVNAFLALYKKLTRSS